MVLEPGVLLTTTKSSYIQGFLYPGVLQLGVLTTKGFLILGSYI